MNLTQTQKGVIYLVLCIVLWSLIGTVAKFSKSGLDHYQYLFYSSIISFLSLFVVAFVSKSLKEILSYSKLVLLFLFFLGFLDFMFYLLLYFGYYYATSLEVLVIQYTWPIFILILSIFILKEKVTKKSFLAMFLGFFGVFLVVTKANFSNFSFVSVDILLVVLLSSFCFALFSVLSKKVKINAINAALIYFFAATIYSSFSMQIFSNFVLPAKSDIFAIVLNGSLINGLSYFF